MYTISHFKKKLNGIWRVTRLLPVLAWSTCAFALGGGLAFGSTASFDWHLMVLVAVAGTLLHCLTAHAFNDLVDWRTGTDSKSPGKLSGGSKVISDGLLNEGNLKVLGLSGLILPVAAGIYLSITKGPLVLVFLLVGIWGGMSYTLPPFMLAYRPFLGEWLAGFPTILSCTTGSFFILTGDITVKALATGIPHGFLSLGWLMQHHLPDLSADMSATPPKITTPVLAYTRWGSFGARLAPGVYFLLAAVAGIIEGFLLDPVFFIAVVPALICTRLALTTDPLNVQSVTKNEILMISITVGHALILTVLLIIML